MPGATFSCEPEETRIVYRELDFEQPWQRFNIERADHGGCREVRRRLPRHTVSEGELIVDEGQISCSLSDMRSSSVGGTLEESEHVDLQIEMSQPHR